MIQADDAGYSDYGFSAALNGVTTVNETPNLDALAQQSVVATQAYVAAPICSPTRAGLLTGQHQQRFGFEENLDNSASRSGTFGLSANQITIAQRLKPLGYATGAIGKWHLGYVDGLNRPLDKGFDEFFGFFGGGRNYFYDLAPERGMRRGDAFYETQYRSEGDPSLYDPVNGRYCTDAFGEEAVSFIDRHADEGTPFFLNVAYSAPHTPYNYKQSDYDHFAHVNEPNDPEARARAALIYAMDRSIGMILDALDANGIADDTYVIMINDHGAPSPPAGSYYNLNKPYRGHKGTTWEGGIRTPLLIRGPGLQAGQFSAPITAYDLLPTIVAAAGGDLSEIPTDGFDMMPYLTGQESGNPHDVMVWRHWKAWSVRKGDWKLSTGYTGGTLPYLYNLAWDPTEIQYFNLAHRDVEAELLAELTRWEATMGKPGWGILSADNQNKFDHFVFRGDQLTTANWSQASAWRQAGTANVVTMMQQDAYANAILEFTVRNDASYTATNDMKRLSTQTFMLNQFRFTGNFSGPASQQASIAGLEVLMVKNLNGELPQIRLDATSGATSQKFTFRISNEIKLLHDLEITGNGTQNFVIAGNIRDYYEPWAPTHPLILMPHSVTKYGSSRVTFSGNNNYLGATNVVGGTLLINGNQAASTGLTTVYSGARLGGTGTIGGSLLMQAGSIFTAAFDGGTIDPLAILGNLDLSATNNILEVTGTGTGNSWVLATYAGTLTGTFESTPGFTVNYGTGSNSQITITLAASGIPGDYNNDGRVDGGDYVRWRNHLGEQNEANINNNGDGGGVTLGDYNYWRQRYGNPGSGSGGLNASVPETSSLLLLTLAATPIAGLRRRPR